jgi:hypothetical protein
VWIKEKTMKKLEPITNSSFYDYVSTVGDAEGEARRAQEVAEIVGTDEPTDEQLEEAFPTEVVRMIVQTKVHMTKIVCGPVTIEATVCTGSK